ncbi:hypothetical protein [Methanosarcina mazei]|nr:hypothetical protein [Methanosarcina mazei]
MSLETGLVKYCVNTPLTIVGFLSMYAFGGVILTFLNTFHEILSGNFIEAFFEYFIFSALPPTSVYQVLLTVAAGTTVAGLKWYVAMSRR